MSKGSNLIAFVILIILGIVGAYFWHLHPSAQAVPYEVRAAMDIGSGATNIKVAKVNPETNQIISILFEKSVGVSYQKALEQSTDNKFNDEVMNQGIQAIKELKADADQYHVKKIVAVATAAFRQAVNAQEFADKITQETGVVVKIINQDEEGILALKGALAVYPVNSENAVIWDIGGGSMQLTALTPQGTYIVSKGATASTQFKNAIIKEIEHQDINQVSTPNPISKEQMNQAIQLAQKSSESINPYIKEKIQDPQTQVLAVGNLFYKSIRGAVNNKMNANQEDLQTAVDSKAGKSDAELGGGGFADVSVSNPLLVLGYMKGLSIHEIHFVDVNNADGVLTYPAYWQ